MYCRFPAGEIRAARGDYAGLFTEISAKSVSLRECLLSCGIAITM
jgi:hypothetical protein